MSLLKYLTQELKGILLDSNCSVVEEDVVQVSIGKTTIIKASESNNLLIVESPFSLGSDLDFGKFMMYEENSKDRAVREITCVIKFAIRKLKEVECLEYVRVISLDHLVVMNGNGEDIACVGIDSDGFYCNLKSYEILEDENSKLIIQEVCKTLKTVPRTSI